MSAAEADCARRLPAQAEADLDAYELLASSSLPICQRLHFLQMWLEKLAKAYLWSDLSGGTYPVEFRTLHNVVAKVVPALVREHWSRIDGRPKPPMDELRRSVVRSTSCIPRSTTTAGGRTTSNILGRRSAGVGPPCSPRPMSPSGSVIVCAAIPAAT